MLPPPENAVQQGNQQVFVWLGAEYPLKREIQKRVNEFANSGLVFFHG